MSNKIMLSIITQEDLLLSNCFDIEDVISVVEETFLNYNEENVIFPAKISVVFDQVSQNRINCLPAGFRDQEIYGMKWVSVFPGNPHRYALPNLSAVYIISELKTGFPLAFMEGALCSNLRTAAVGAVAAKYLARSDSECIGFIGAGEQAKAHFMAMKAVLPSLRECRVSSRTSNSEEKFISQLSHLYPDVNFVQCASDYERAVEGADVIVTAISGQERILKADWIKQGVFYCHVAGLEDEYAVAQKANKIVVDEWDVVKHRTQTISRMYKEGLLKDSDIYADLHEIVKGRKPGRMSDSEFVYFNSVGMSYIDTAVAYSMYKKVKASGRGTEIEICKDSMFDADEGLIII